MILPKGEKAVKDKDGMQQELRCPGLTGKYSWLQERAIGLGDRVAKTKSAHEQRRFLSSNPCAHTWWELCPCDPGWFCSV